MDNKKTKGGAKRTGRAKGTEQSRAIAAWQDSHESVELQDNRVIARRISTTNTSSDLFARSKSLKVSDKISLCRSAYYNVGIIGNVVDIMTDFALEGFMIAHESEAAERLFMRWAKKVKLYETMEEVLRNIFRDGNVPVIHYNANISANSVNKMKRAVASRADAEDLFSTPEVEDAVIPYKFRVLDVLKLKEDGTDIFGRQQYYYLFDGDDVINTLGKKDAETLALIETLKKQMGEKAWQKFKTTGYFPLPDLDIIFYKKDSYSTWAIPMLWRVIDDLKFKTTLRNMDVSIAESITNAVQIFKIGSVKDGYRPTPAMYTKLIDMLRNPSKSKTIVWDDLIALESDYPDTGKILGSDKYEEVNADLLAGIGVSPVLVGKEGGAYANSFLSCRTLLERLETARVKALRWVEPYLLQVTRALKFRKPPHVKFANMSLRDEIAEKKMLLDLADRNVISYRTLVERFGENFDIEIKRMRREDTLRKRMEDKYPNALKKLGKFGPTDQGPEMAEETPAQQESQGDKGGRPENEGRPGVLADKQEVQRDTKPQGMAASEMKLLRKEAYKAFMKIKKVIAQQVADSRDISVTDLEAAEVAEIGDISMEVLARFEDIKNINRNNIADAVFYKVTAPAKLDRCVKRVYKQLLKRYRKKTGNAPGEKQKDKLRSSAWAICRKQLGV
jgi:hypothetical protein